MMSSMISTKEKKVAQRLDAQLALRLAPDVRKAFINKAAPFGGYSKVLRELATAWIEDRLTITPPDHIKELYK